MKPACPFRGLLPTAALAAGLAIPSHGHAWDGHGQSRDDHDAWFVGPAQQPRGDAPTSDDATAQAKAALRRALAATRAKDYSTALTHFEHALRLSPSPKLHFNIAVCHHRLMGEHAEGTKPYEQHRQAAVTSYNHYLATEPQDAEAVESVIVALGGTPVTDNPEPWTIELVEPGETPDPPGFDEEWIAGASTPDPAPEPGDPDAAQTPEKTDDVAGPQPGVGPQPVVPPQLRGRVGVFIPLFMAHPGQMIGSSTLSGAPMLGLGLRGNAFIGPARRLGLGAEFVVVRQTMGTNDRHRLGGGNLSLMLDYRHPLGDGGRYEIGASGVVGVGTEILEYTGADGLRCANGREASRRNGLWTGARVVGAVLLGKDRNNELSLRLGPGLAANSEGSRANEDADGMSCAGEPSAFTTLGLRHGATLVVSFDLGYARRF